MFNHRLFLIILLLPIFLFASVDYNKGSLISTEGGLPPTVPTLIRIFDNAIINTYNTSYECIVSIVSIVSTDPDDDDIMYEILWDTNPLFKDDEDPPTTIPIGFHNSGDTVISAIPTEQETIYYWKARAKDKGGGGSWTDWSEIRSFTMDMEAGDVYWYQVDSAQFEKGIKENVFVENNMVRLLSGQNNGSLISPPIVFNELNEENSRSDWSGVKLKKSSANDSIGVQIERKAGGNWSLVPNDTLPGNSDGFFDKEKDFFSVNLQDLKPVIYDSIRIKAIFIRGLGKASVYPALEMWAMGNIEDNITIIEENEEPILFALNKVKSNPSVGNIEINYQIPERTEVKLIVFDLLGRNVRTLVEEVKESGYYSIQWRGLDKNNRPLPPGIYFLRMEAGDFIETQKILRIK
jgi:hypothetical protein